MTRPHQLHEKSLLLILVNLLHVVYSNNRGSILLKTKQLTYGHTESDLQPEAWLQPKQREESQIQANGKFVSGVTSSSLRWDITDHWSSKFKLRCYDASDRDIFNVANI